METGVLLINLGTPKSYQPKDVKEYLLEFLLDPYVIDIPWALRQFLVRFLIVPRRFKESAKLYESIWMKEGSPLMVHGLKVSERLQESLGEEFMVDLAMRYQERSIDERIAIMQQRGVKRIVFLPLFPQFAEATTGSIVKKILNKIRNEKFFPEYKIITNFEKHPLMIDAIVSNIKKFDLSEYDHLILSFHGLPIRHLKKLNVGCNEKKCCERQEDIGCYKKQCLNTAKTIIEKLNIDKSKVSVTFQSRLGKEPWIEPYTYETALKLLSDGKKRILVACPAFVADCIETLSEIAIEYKENFIRQGGEKFDLVPSLNDHSTWIEALKEIVLSRS